MLLDDKAIMHALADSIAAYERSYEFASFDSKFDRVLRGETEFAKHEARGRDLFVDEKKGNCAACHLMPEKHSNRAESLFTDVTYDNLGVPEIALAPKLNG